MTLGLDAALTLAVVAGVVGLLAGERVNPSLVVLGGVIVLLLLGVVTPSQAFSGFSNPAPITVGALYVLARSVDKTGVIEPLIARVLSGGGGTRARLARLVAPVAGASAFINNTPVVALLIPRTLEHAKRTGDAPSRYLLPISYAAILGGTVTAIGTSTTIVVSGLLVEAGEPAIGLFEITSWGLPIALLGLAILVLAGARLLPDRRSPQARLREDRREFTVNLEVVEGGPLDGATVEGGGLRHLEGVFLAEVHRGVDVIAPAAPTTTLHGRDVLTFVGRADQVLDLQNRRGLRAAAPAPLEPGRDVRHRVYEAVVGVASPLNGRTLKEVGFRERYQGVVLAVHRAGEPLRAKLGEVKLRYGDTLVVMADPGFRDRWLGVPDFLLVAPTDLPAPQRGRGAWLAVTVGAAVVVSAALGWLPILHAALAGAMAVVALRLLTPSEARRALDLDVLIIIAGSFGLGAAMRVSGLAEFLSGSVLTVARPLGEIGIALGVVLAAIALTELITNNAAAVLMFPVVLEISDALGWPLRPLALALAVAASASFLSPLGYQTNTMVYGPGGYRFTDYVRVGWPLTLMVVVVLVWRLTASIG